MPLFTSYCLNKYRVVLLIHTITNHMATYPCIFWGSNNQTHGHVSIHILRDVTACSVSKYRMIESSFLRSDIPAMDRMIPLDVEGDGWLVTCLLWYNHRRHSGSGRRMLGAWRRIEGGRGRKKIGWRKRKRRRDLKSKREHGWSKNRCFIKKQAKAHSN